MQGKAKTLLPEEVSAMILAEMKRVAEDFLGTKASEREMPLSDQIENTGRDEAPILI